MSKKKAEVVKTEDWQVRAKGLEMAKTIIGELDDAVAETGEWPIDDVSAEPLPALTARNGGAIPHWKVTGIVIHGEGGLSKRTPWKVYLVKRRDEFFLGNVLLDEKLMLEMEPYLDLLKEQTHGK